jgi:GntR family transcriptional regulator/MocR family aminotransferase
MRTSRQILLAHAVGCGWLRVVAGGWRGFFQLAFSIEYMDHGLAGTSSFIIPTGPGENMLRPWDLRIVLARDTALPAYLQIANTLIEAIRGGRLAPGSALPGTRELASRIGVNRKTVQQSYDELVAQGWLTAESTRGTFVSALLPVIERQPDSKAPRVPKTEFQLRRTAPDLPFVASAPGMLTFDDGAPDTRLMPADMVARTYRRALLEKSHHNRLGYADPRGSLGLREAVAAMLRADRGLNCGPENICITRGSQMAIFLSARLLAEPGDAIAFETLSYPPAREAFRAAGAEICAVGMDEHGLDVDALEALCRRKTIRAIYVTPHHQFPTTIVLPPERRIRLASLAEQYNFAIVEDDYDHEFHFSHRPLLPMANAQGFGRLLYIGSLSKLLSPSLRIGYLVGSKRLIDRAAAEVMMIDRQGDPVTEAAAAELMTTGVLKSHARKVLRIYAARREMLAANLARHFGEHLHFTQPQGGLALWVNFGAGTDTVALAQAARRQNVAFTPGQFFATDGTKNSGARLGFGSMDEAELSEAVQRLRWAV